MFTRQGSARARSSGKSSPTGFMYRLAWCRAGKFVSAACQGAARMSDKGSIAVLRDLAASELGDNGRAALAEVCGLPVRKTRPSAKRLLLLIDS